MSGSTLKTPRHILYVHYFPDFEAIDKKLSVVTEYLLPKQHVLYIIPKLPLLSKRLTYLMLNNTTMVKPRIFYSELKYETVVK